MQWLQCWKKYIITVAKSRSRVLYWFIASMSAKVIHHPRSIEQNWGPDLYQQFSLKVRRGRTVSKSCWDYNTHFSSITNYYFQILKRFVYNGRTLAILEMRKVKTNIFFLKPERAHTHTHIHTRYVNEEKVWICMDARSGAFFAGVYGLGFQVT